MLIDTDVLVWITRGHAGAAARLQALTPWRISAVTYMELAQGCRDKQELARIKEGAGAGPDGESHGMQLGDALIAATALEHGTTVLTSNAKHFSTVDGLTVEVFVP